MRLEPASRRPSARSGTRDGTRPASPPTRRSAGTARRRRRRAARTRRRCWHQVRRSRLWTRWANILTATTKAAPGYARRCVFASGAAVAVLGNAPRDGRRPCPALPLSGRSGMPPRRRQPPREKRPPITRAWRYLHDRLGAVGDLHQLAQVIGRLLRPSRSPGRSRATRARRADLDERLRERATDVREALEFGFAGAGSTLREVHRADESEQVGIAAGWVSRETMDEGLARRRRGEP